MDIGIIGGADGPTSILVSGPDIGTVLIGTALVLLVAGLIVYALQRRRT